MQNNLNLTNGIFFSQRVLLELTNVGFTREDAYKIVQKNALNAWKENASFYNKILSDKKINNKISVNKLKKLFNFSYHTKRINIIFSRCLKKR
jgi:adenylosuccinate lyase